MKKFIVVAYDIANNKRRKKVADTLLKYGSRSNYSVFECFITQKQIDTLKAELHETIKPKKDVILFYQLCKNCLETKQYIGNFTGTSSLINSI